jgi:hypothetical protein
MAIYGPDDGDLLDRFRIWGVAPRRYVAPTELRAFRRGWL